MQSRLLDAVEVKDGMEQSCEVKRLAEWMEEQGTFSVALHFVWNVSLRSTYMKQENHRGGQGARQNVSGFEEVLLDPEVLDVCLCLLTR